MKKIRTLVCVLAACLLPVTSVTSGAEDALGDLNGDGLIDAADAAALLTVSAGIGAGEGAALPDGVRPDVNGDGETNASDAEVILRYAAYTGSGGTASFAVFVNGEFFTAEAVFLGVKDWGKSGTTLANAGTFRYRFLVGDEEREFPVSTTADENGKSLYPIQNLLKVDYHFIIEVENGTIVHVTETEERFPDYTPPVSGVPGERTLCNFLRTAMEPVGTTLYMFGGGWNWQDTGSGLLSERIGVQLDWVRFYQEHDTSYTYRDKNGNTANPDPPNSYYPYGGFNQYHYAGLDCSGFVSWAVYNTLHDTDGLPGYGGKSTQMARRFSGYGWGEWTHSFPTPDGTAATAFCPGDIMSEKGHVWISLGTCADGSIVIAHSTPSYSHAGQPGGGVQIGAVGSSERCQAYQLAQEYMTAYYPDWCSRYRVTLKSPGEYLAVKAADCGRFRWSTEFLADPEGLQSMSADDALALIFGRTSVLDDAAAEG